MREITYVQAIGEALTEEMRRDKKVFLIGESIQGASFGITAGMVQEFGEDRVMDTPIAETGIVGAALGSSMMGYRPVVDNIFKGFPVAFFTWLQSEGSASYFCRRRWRYDAGQ